MANVTLRADSLVPLTNDQVDANFVNLNNDIQTRVSFNLAPLSGANLLPNSSAELGSYLWSGFATAETGSNAEGTLFRMPNYSSSSSFTQSSNMIPLASGVSVWLQCELYTLGVTSGVVSVTLNYFNSASSFIGTAAVPISAINGANWTYYSVQNTTPPNTAYVEVAFGYTNVISTDCAIRRIKLSSALTPYSQEATVLAMSTGNANVAFNVGTATAANNAVPLSQLATSTVENITGTLSVAQGGTGATANTGTGYNVLNTSPILVSPTLGTPVSGNLVNCAFPTLNQNTTGTASNITGTLAVAQGGTGTNSTIGTGSNVLQNYATMSYTTLISPYLGTPASGNLENCTFPTLNQNTTGNAASANVATNVVGGSVNASTGDFTGNVSVGGNLHVTGTISNPSDERLKDQWKSVQDDFLTALSNVKSGTYNRIDIDSCRQIGVSAQSLRNVIPEAIIEDSDGMLSVSYGNAALVACIELSKEVIRMRKALTDAGISN